MLDVWFETSNSHCENKNFCGQWIVNKEKLKDNDNVFRTTSNRRWQKDVSQVPNIGRIDIKCDFFLETPHGQDKQIPKVSIFFSGTGTIVDENGMIVVTSAHVVGDFVEWVSYLVFFFLFFFFVFLSFFLPRDQ